MASKFSVWLRETARLYLHYMAVGLVSVPLALVYALAAQGGWKQKALLPFLAIFGIVAASLVWRRMGDWQIKPRVVVSAFEASWAEMLKVTIQMSAPLQYGATLAEDTLRTWNEVLGPAFLASHEVKMIQISLSRASESAPIQMLTSQPTEALQLMLAGQRTPLHSTPKNPSATSDTTPQSTPASAFALGRQIRAGAHGLA